MKVKDLITILLDCELEKNIMHCSEYNDETDGITSYVNDLYITDYDEYYVIENKIRHYSLNSSKKINHNSDGYHHFEELYEHRNALFLLMCKISGWPCWYIPEHHPGYICVYLETPEGQISYHLSNKYLYAVQKISALQSDQKWDDHTSGLVCKRLIDNIFENL